MDDAEWSRKVVSSWRVADVIELLVNAMELSINVL